MTVPELFGSLDDVAACEERLMNCWPSHQTVMLGDWLCRFAKGYSGRANSACSFRPGAAMGELEIAVVERLYVDAGLPPSFRFSPLINARFRARVEALGYRPDDASVGMIGAAFSDPVSEDLRLEATPSPAWLEGACRWQQPSKRDPAHLLGIVGNIRVPTRFATLFADDVPVAYGLISHDRGMAEFGAVMVDPARRGNGLGRKLVSGMIGWAHNDGAARIFLQAAIDNDVARGLYRSLGFRDLYTAAYWRRPT
ncbi:MAG TPA: GNAT family N-acetyltransferase [Rhabdaerophilum sp.]|nr:GNAT family N-acetyltransferase [Rhabdaerophilum sp.]